MATWIALLRGINVGGNNRLPMAALGAIIEAAGGRDARTYIQSGNAAFEADADRAPSALGAAIRDAIRAGHGFTPHVLLRDAAYLQRIVDGNPYPEAAGAPKTLHVFFLDAAPLSPDLAGLEGVRSGGEAFVLDGDALYLHAPEGIGRSKLAVKAERLLGVPATARNWATVTALLEVAAR